MSAQRRLAAILVADVVGFSRLVGTDETGTLARQGTGVGSWLLQRIDKVARARGSDSLSLETTETAVANIRLNRRHGFEIVCRGPPDHGLDSHARLYMEKSF